MKTKHLLALLAMCCGVAALAGCASSDRQMSESSLDEKNLERRLDLTNGPVTFDEWRHFDTNTGAKERFSAPDEKNDDWQINVTEFLTQAPKHSQLYSILGGSDQTSNSDFSWDGQEFQPQGLRLFTIRF